MPDFGKHFDERVEQMRASRGWSPLMTEPTNEEGQGWRVVESDRDDGGWLVVGNDREKAWCWTRATARQIVADHTAALESRKAEQSCQHKTVSRLKDAGEYGFENPTDWEWCAGCGAVRVVGKSFWSLPARRTPNLPRKLAEAEQRIRDLETALRDISFECPDCKRGIERYEGSGWEDLNQPWFHKFKNPMTGHEKTWLCSSTPANDRARALLTSSSEGSAEGQGGDGHE